MKTRNYDYVQYDELATRTSVTLKSIVEELHEAIERNIQPSRERSLAITRLEEVWMRCGRALRDETICRNPKAADVRERNDS